MKTSADLRDFLNAYSLLILPRSQWDDNFFEVYLSRTDDNGKVITSENGITVDCTSPDEDDEDSEIFSVKSCIDELFEFVAEEYDDPQSLEILRNLFSEKFESVLKEQILLLRDWSRSKTIGFLNNYDMNSKDASFSIGTNDNDLRIKFKSYNLNEALYCGLYDDGDCIALFAIKAFKEKLFDDDLLVECKKTLETAAKYCEEDYYQPVFAENINRIIDTCINDVLGGRAYYISSSKEEYMRISAESESESFDVDEVVGAAFENQCAFSAHVVNLCIDRVKTGERNLTPGANKIPKNMNFLDESGNRCFARIQDIIVLDKNKLGNIQIQSYSSNYHFGVGFSIKNSNFVIIFLLGFINKSTEDKNLLFYKSPKTPAMTQVTVKNSLSGDTTVSTMIYKEEDCELILCTDSELKPYLAPYLMYYMRLLDDLSVRKDYGKIDVDIEFLRENFDVLSSLIPDDDLIVLPVKSKPQRISGLTMFVDYYDKDTRTKYDFYEAEITPLGKEDLESYLEVLKENEIELPKNDSLLLLDIIELHDKDRFVFQKVFTNAEVSNCLIIENVEGEKVRIRRIVSGIENSLRDNVTNKQLVNTICKNDISSSIYQLLGTKRYEANHEYIEYLKKEYPVLAGNKEQLEAIDKIVQMDDNKIDIMLVQGPPGTGKTELILSLAKELIKKKYHTLITSNVHVACDNVAERLRNFKDIVLKRYTAVRGDQYFKEIIENQKRYVENQVLAGFQFKDEIIFDNDTYNSILDSKTELEKKRQQMLLSKEEYDEKLSLYHELLNEKEALQNDIENLKEEIGKIETLIKGDQSAVENSTKEKNVALKELDSLETKLKAQIEKLNEIINEQENTKKAINDLYAKIDEAEKAILSCKENIEKTTADIQRLNSELKNENSFLHFLNYTKPEDIKLAVLSYAEERKDFSSKHYDRLLTNSLDSIKSAIALLDVLKKDSDFWNGNKEVSNATFSYIFFKFSKTAAAKELISDVCLKNLEVINAFNKCGGLKKGLMKVFSFVKVKGKTRKEIDELLEKLNSDLKHIQFNFGDVVLKLAHEEISENALNELKNSILAHTEEIKDSIKHNEELVEKLNIDIDDYERLIPSSRKEITTKSSSLVKLNKEVAQEEDKKKVLEEKIDSVNASIALLDEKIRSFENELSNHSTNKDELDKKYLEKSSHLADTIRTLESESEKLGSALDDYDAFVNRFNIDLTIVDRKIAELSGLLETIDQKIGSLVDNGWSKEEAISLMTNYTTELKNIVSADDDKIANYLTGKGNTFERMFLLTNGKDGSLISMTTNQVASLLNTSGDKELSFDYAIIDEASKCKFEDLIISLPKIKHLILIGDFMQLDPMSKDFKNLDLSYQSILKIDQWESLNKSPFSMLLSQFVEFNDSKKIPSFDSNPSVAVMKKQYRMNKGIFDLIKPIYSIHEGFELIDEKKMTSNDLMCIDIDGSESSQGTSFSNEAEAEAIIEILKSFKENSENYKGIKSIGIITGYRAQQSYINRKLKGFKIPGIKIQIGTFDRFQGREYDLVFVSLVRTIKLGFTNNIRRMNVAFSRAKQHLIVLGNFDALLKIATNSYKPASEENTNPDVKENNFVVQTLIPNLHSKKRRFASSKDRVSAVLDFLKEEDYE